MAFARLVLFVLALVAVVFVISSVESLPAESSNVVYNTQYIRGRSSSRNSGINPINSVYDNFQARRRPPPLAFINDEDLTRFVRCDYDPSLPDCDDSGLLYTIDETSTLTVASVHGSTNSHPATTTVVPGSSQVPKSRAGEHSNNRVDEEDEGEDIIETAHGDDYDEIEEDDENWALDGNYLTEDNGPDYPDSDEDPAVD